MALKIKIVKEADPWDAFVDGETGKEGAPATTGLRDILQRYTAFLAEKGKEAGACLVCERRFREKKGGA